MKFLLELPTLVVLWLIMMPGMIWLKHQNIFSIVNGIQFRETKQYFSLSDLYKIDDAPGRSLVDGYSTRFATVMRHQHYTRPALILAYGAASVFYLLEGLSYAARSAADMGLLTVNYQFALAPYLSGLGNASIFIFFLIYWLSGMFKLLVRTKVGQVNQLTIWLATASLLGKTTKL